MTRASLLLLGASLKCVDDLNPVCSSDIYIIIFCYDGNIHLIQRYSPLNFSYIVLFALHM
jgi:hypothetical protein